VPVAVPGAANPSSWFVLSVQVLLLQCLWPGALADDLTVRGDPFIGAPLYAQANNSVEEIGPGPALVL
jgi:hypothetical protein